MTRTMNIGPAPKEEYTLKEGMKCNQCFYKFKKGDWGYVCYETGQFACSQDCENKMGKTAQCYSILIQLKQHIHVKVSFK